LGQGEGYGLQLLVRLRARKVRRKEKLRKE